MNGMGVDLLSLVVSIAAVFVAGIIRGYSGFGFAMVAVTSMSLVFPPVQVVPTVLILEVLASIRLVPQVWRHIDWSSLRWLLIGSLVATPFGVYLLATIPPTPMRISISLLVLVAAILLMRGFAWKQMPSIALILTTGVVSGMLNGAADRRSASDSFLLVVASGSNGIACVYYCLFFGHRRDESGYGVNSRPDDIQNFVDDSRLFATPVVGHCRWKSNVHQCRQRILSSPCADSIDNPIDCWIVSINIRLKSVCK